MINFSKKKNRTILGIIVIILTLAMIAPMVLSTLIGIF